MKKLLILLFSLFFLSSPSVFADNYIPSIEKIFKERIPLIPAGLPFYGCIYHVEWGEEDLFTQKRRFKSIKIGTPEKSATLYINDLHGLFEGDEEVPDNGDCFAFTSSYGLVKFSESSYSASAKIFLGKYKVDNIAKEIKLKNQITVDEYFQDNLSYGNKRFTLIGEVEETWVTTMGNEFGIRLITKDGNNQITAWLYPHQWVDDESLKEKLRSMKMGDVLKLKGFFMAEMGSPYFEILKIIDFNMKLVD
tara:strand:- start:59 stop:808 length:750 start_codon:yes stop_codon:yes gene_type:complete